MSLTKAEKWVVWGIPVLFILGGGLHFLYDLLGKSAVIGAIAPVNESVWEHKKIVLWPVILWWSLYYFLKGRERGVNGDKWFAGALTSLLVSLLVIPMGYYFYTGAFGVELMWVDILLLLVALALGQVLGLHVYRRGGGLPSNAVLVVFLLLALFFVWMTFAPWCISPSRKSPGTISSMPTTCLLMKTRS